MFTEADIKALLRTTPSAPPFVELLSGTGIIIESTLRTEISNRILDSPNSPGRTSVFELAKEFLVEARAVERLLPTQQEGWARIGASTIITAHELQQLREQIDKELETDVVYLSSFCKKNSIDVELFRRLPSGRYQWLGNDRESICSASFLNRVRLEIFGVLEEADGPVELCALFPEKGLPPALMQAVVVPMVKEAVLDGNVKNGYYVPNKYVQAQQDALVESLKLEGILELESLRRESVQGPTQFIAERIPGARLLETHLVTAEFVANAREQVSGKVSAQMWSDLKFLDTRLTPADISSLIKILNTLPGPTLEKIGAYIVSTELSPALISTSTSFAESLAKKALTKRTPNPTLRSQDLSKHLSSIAPPQLVAHFIPTLQPLASSLLSSHLEALKLAESTAAKQAFAEKYLTRLIIYHRGISDLVDKSLKSKLSSDLLTHAHEIIIPALDKLPPTIPTPDIEEFRSQLTSSDTPADVIAHFTTFLGDKATPSEEAIQAMKRAIISDLKAKLEGSNDASLVVLITCLLLFASGSQGVLKASGKYVPKLLKDLKRKKAGQEVMDVLERVKQGVVGGAAVAEEDLEVLKGVGRGGL